MTEGIFTFAQLVETLGHDDALRLVAAYGGQRKHIPAAHYLRTRQDHWLVACVGRDKAMRLAELFPMSMEVTIPTATAYRRNSLVRKLLFQGVSVNAIVAASGVHIRTVRRRRADLKKEGLL